MNNVFSGVYDGLTVLVTGHTGFKGSWLTTWLLQLGANVIGYSLEEAPTSPSNFVISDLASSIDLLPTVLRACSISAPADLPGIDLLDEAARRNRTAVFGATYSIHNMTPGRPSETLQYRWCIDGNWKLLLRHHGTDTTRYRTVHQWDTLGERLYELSQDAAEQVNLAQEHPEVVKRLKAQIDRQIPFKAQADGNK